jgi:peroxiredoxin 2/4
MEETQESQFKMPLINEKAPDFDAWTTHGQKKLKDYEGKWLILFSHPADFTPVCSTEFMGFQSKFEDFKKINTELLGLSIDSVFAHIAWIRSLKEKFNVEIKFPIIEDLSMKVAKSFGMIHPGAGDTSAVRATFIIDPKGIVRALIYYPMSNGRSIDEIYRLVTALQETQKTGFATPENWHLGDKMIVPPPKTAQDAETRLKSEFEVTDWYFSKAPSGTSNQKTLS